MAYQYQSFGSGQIFTSAQAQQIEDNIRDHVHGKDGVSPAGASWEVQSKGAAFTIASTDVGKLFQCYGDYAVNFPAAGALGASFATALKNVGSGRVQLTASSGQYIEGNSFYSLAPGESVIAQSDASNLILVGANHGMVRLARFASVGSLAQFEITHFYPGEFQKYMLRGRFAISATGIANAVVSIDSGSSYLGSGYTGTMSGATTLWALHDGGAGSIALFTEFEWSPLANAGTQARGLSIRGTVMTEYNLFQTTVGEINAIRLSPSAGAWQSGCVVELYGIGRIRNVI